MNVTIMNTKNSHSRLHRLVFRWNEKGFFEVVFLCKGSFIVASKFAETVRWRWTGLSVVVTVKFSDLSNPASIWHAFSMMCISHIFHSCTNDHSINLVICHHYQPLAYILTAIVLFRLVQNTYSYDLAFNHVTFRIESRM